MLRRRAILNNKSIIPIIPIGVELINYNSPNWETGKYINGAEVGTYNYTTADNPGNIITPFLPYDSDYVFEFKGNSNSGGALCILCDENYIIWNYRSSLLFVNDMQQIAKSVEAQNNVKIKYIKITCTTANFNDRAISYKRIS